MKITIIGTGYVGLVTAACLAEMGNHVFCLDIDRAKIDLLNSGGLPIYEPGLKEMIERNTVSRRLTFSTDIVASVAHGSVQLIAVDTPPDKDGSADLQNVLTVARNIGRYMSDFKVVVNKSTVPVGTADKVTSVIREELANRFVNTAKKEIQRPTFTVVSNPEFLKVGSAVEDFRRPHRIVVGADGTPFGLQALATMRELYAPFISSHESIIVMDVKSAEFTKYAANVMLATRISLMNELANLSELVGADIELVRQGIGSDPRIGFNFLYAGIGYGGSCLPKDVMALIQTGRENRHKLRLLEAVEAINEEQQHVLVHKVFARYGQNLTGMILTVWGLAFKPNTTSMSHAPSRIFISAMLKAGARIHAHDPVAEDEARRILALDLADAPALLEKIQFMENPMDALRGADALIVITEWDDYRSPNWAALKTAMKSKVIFDGRNTFDLSQIKSQGIEYHGIGRYANTPALRAYGNLQNSSAS
jgi:UDPglucose 6-dehydrogenase